MKQFPILLVLLLLPPVSFAQEKNILRTGVTAEQNLAAIGNISPGMVGGYGIDERYAGTKGSPMLYDDLRQAFMRIEGQDIYITVDANIDLIRNLLIFVHPSTKRTMSLPPEAIVEVLFETGEGEQVFRNTSGMVFGNQIKGLRFCQILFEEGEHLFIKIPVRTFREADYRNAYSPDRRYDEFEASARYYINDRKGRLTQITLTERSLIKLFPEKKAVIKRIVSSHNFRTEEEMVIEVLKQIIVLTSSIMA